MFEEFISTKLTNSLGTDTGGAALVSRPGRCSRSDWYEEGFANRSVVLDGPLDKPAICVEIELEQVAICLEAEGKGLCRELSSTEQHPITFALQLGDIDVVLGDSNIDRDEGLVVMACLIDELPPSVELARVVGRHGAVGLEAGAGFDRRRGLDRASGTADVTTEATDAARADVASGPTNGVHVVSTGAAGGVGGDGAAAVSLVGVVGGVVAGPTARDRHHSAEGDDEHETPKRHCAPRR